MIVYRHNLDVLYARLRVELTFIPFFRALSLKAAQEDYFLRDGVDGGVQLAEGTVKARARRWGYYRRPNRSKVSAGGPYGVWTGNTLEHTHEEKGTIKIRVGSFSLQHDLKRRISAYWNEADLDRRLEAAVETWFQRAFDLRPPLRRISA